MSDESDRSASANASNPQSSHVTAPPLKSTASGPESDNPNTILLDRPIEQRVREYKYRFAQTVVFGLPVLVLHFFGPMLGGSEVERMRWLGVLQLILTGWILYIGAAGMIFEGAYLLLAGRGLHADMLAATGAGVLFAYSAVSVLHVLKDGTIWYGPLLFYAVVLLLAGWNGWRWYCLNKTTENKTTAGR